jgi:hypothetical protein
MRAKRMTRRPRRRKEKKLAIFHSTATHTALPLSEIRPGNLILMSFYLRIIMVKHNVNRD